MDGSTHELFPVAIPRTEAESLSRWVRRENSRASIEIGLGYGISALAILASLPPEGHHLVLDPNQRARFSNCGLEAVEDAGMSERLTFLEEPSETALPRLMTEERRFDFAFVDGNHRFDGVFRDLTYLARLLRPGSVVVLDDYQLPAIAKAVGFFQRNLDWRIEEEDGADPLHHWAVVRTADTPDERPFDHFVGF
jgi:predicted O-methyltransferase YrrM